MKWTSFIGPPYCWSLLLSDQKAECGLKKNMEADCDVTSLKYDLALNATFVSYIWARKQTIWSGDRINNCNTSDCDRLRQLIKKTHPINTLSVNLNVVINLWQPDALFDIKSKLSFRFEDQGSTLHPAECKCSTRFTANCLSMHLSFSHLASALSK